jgi:hypothetical protein
MKKTLAFTFFTFFFGAFFLAGCKRDEAVCDGTNSTYDGNIVAIINDNCTNSNCHGAGASNGDMTTYDKLEPYLNNGSFRREVLIDQTMPQGAARLSQDELNAIQCWYENGYPEN